MIRAFITTWSVVANYVHNPIVDYVDTLTDMGIVCDMHYPDADQNGIPDRDRVLIIVQGPPQIENLNAIQGVRMLPAYRFQKPLSEIPENIKQAIKAAIVAEGIPLSALFGMVVYGDFLKKVARYFNASHKGFGMLETEREAEFG